MIRRKQKKPTAKQALERLKEAERELLLTKLEFNEEMKNASIKFDMIVKMFQVVLNDAATIGEARRWFEVWTKDVDDAETDEDIANLIERHGFEFSINDSPTNLFKETA